MIKKITFSIILFSSIFSAHNLPEKQIQDLQEIHQQSQKHKKEKEEALENVKTAAHFFLIGMATSALGSLIENKDESIGIQLIGACYTILAIPKYCSSVRHMVWPDYPDPEKKKKN